ncbi:distal membrane-arm assembly complex protein 2 isoform X2 [Rhineura floridana]|uniref:distal membrane-arm assembly complex protein 2 isoform X2 n=1 Tax=Rhineura floridana TaxID=261503 RepID=UPI002AC83B2A|nr:distal membrane-arm assembly complex protein 2 isoform X2 [Rhineura floridana]XP_061454039.1 distal membrane-arm assembly complex protein 2 isoform X2 [Rhineura floridana]
MMRRSRGFASLWDSSLRYNSNSTAPAPDLMKGQILQYLHNRFYDIELFINICWNVNKWNIGRKNRYLTETQKLYGDNLAAAFFALSLKGRVRFQGEKEWYPEKYIRWKSRESFRKLVETPLEAVDVSGSVITYDGLDNLVYLQALKHLDLSRCPNIDDWSLNRLHVFADRLQELSLAGCPRITENGLACLHHLENLKRLDVSDLPSIPNKGLVRILLQEMLPQCDIVGMDFSEGLGLSLNSHELGGEIEEEHKGAAGSRKGREVPV